MAISDYIPQISGSGILVWTSIIVVLALVMLIGAISFYFIYVYFQYNNRIVLYKKINGKIVRIKSDRARIIRIGEGGDTVFVTRKTKKYLPNPTIQSGPREFWFYIREDDEWINIGWTDIDEQMKEMKAHFLDKEMRYARVGLQKNLRDRLIKPQGFLSKYGAQIMVGLFLIIILIIMYFIFDKYVDLIDKVNAAIAEISKITATQNEITTKLGNIQGGGGLVPS